MTAAIWSTPPDKCALDFPARTLVNKMVVFCQVYGTKQLLSEGPIHAQPSPIATHRKAFMVDDTRRQVRLSNRKQAFSELNVCFSKAYVNKITSSIPKCQKHLSSPVVSVTNTGGQSNSIELRTADGRTEQFEHVIFACHSDTALRILKHGNCTEQEDRILSKFEWNRNEAVLHSDPAVSGIFIIEVRLSRSKLKYLYGS